MLFVPKCMLFSLLNIDIFLIVVVDEVFVCQSLYAWAKALDHRALGRGFTTGPWLGWSRVHHWSMAGMPVIIHHYITEQSVW